MHGGDAAEGEERKRLRKGGSEKKKMKKNKKKMRDEQAIKERRVYDQKWRRGQRKKTMLWSKGLWRQ